MAERTDIQGATRRETASLLAQAIVQHIATRVHRNEPARLQPTIFIALRRGEDPSWKDVVVRSV
jgi:hypothetical protein